MHASLSARRAWIEIVLLVNGGVPSSVALRKESVDRNAFWKLPVTSIPAVALRKESVDRNVYLYNFKMFACMSLSARRAWIEIIFLAPMVLIGPSRSPQGERG